MSGWVLGTALQFLAWLLSCLALNLCSFGKNELRLVQIAVFDTSAVIFWDFLCSRHLLILQDERLPTIYNVVVLRRVIHGNFYLAILLAISLSDCSRQVLNTYLLLIGLWRFFIDSVKWCSWPGGYISRRAGIPATNGRSRPNLITPDLALLQICVRVIVNR